MVEASAGKLELPSAFDELEVSGNGGRCGCEDHGSAGKCPAPGSRMSPNRDQMFAQRIDYCGWKQSQPILLSLPRRTTS